MASDEIVWQYTPFFPLAVIASILYGIIFLHLFYLTVIRYRAWFFLAVVVGAAVEVAAYSVRCYSVKNQTQVTPFVLTLTWTVLAPVLVAAGNYLLIGRLIRAVLPPSHHTVFKLPARFLTRLYVSCDILSFFVQGGGSGVASSDNWTGNTGRIGTYILIGGLSFQAFAFGTYLCVLVRFHVLARRMEVEDAPAGWRLVLKGVYTSSSLIMLRSIYRVAEFSEGTDGYAFRHEWLFWVFETLPMLIAIGVFCVWHPSKYLGSNGAKIKSPKKHKDLEMRKTSRRFGKGSRGENAV
ncbi:RTA1 domain containing protein (7-aminocholesterol resistance protein) [Colletotrichum truncatum]|uniref:RTA1 domain containing protein (7-aminocholesterol resistance protein) n=1 Tax=Colletotrichum truncatum TaxID=5467 RepID=A0ACC3ZCA1_COLTU|nr:RTA1 domain containing protein (7-aminocholesterol resistance protein) [Colletotrichum truncatum]KAF6797686.1 RTA1 domain containing protein (7-aminocholesterol resistance protein) [Colletotrichum truncatum]